MAPQNPDGSAQHGEQTDLLDEPVEKREPER
jgi:hypothetical protein